MINVMDGDLSKQVPCLIYQSISPGSMVVSVDTGVLAAKSSSVFMSNQSVLDPSNLGSDIFILMTQKHKNFVANKLKFKICQTILTEQQGWPIV